MDDLVHMGIKTILLFSPLLGTQARPTCCLKVLEEESDWPWASLLPVASRHGGLGGESEVLAHGAWVAPAVIRIK